MLVWGKAFPYPMGISYTNIPVSHKEIEDFHSAKKVGENW